MFVEIIIEDSFVSDTSNAKFSTQVHTGLAFVHCLKDTLRLFLGNAGWSPPTGITEQTWKPASLDHIFT